MESTLLVRAGAFFAGISDHGVDRAGTLVGVWVLVMVLLTFTMRYFKRKMLKKLSRSAYTLLTGKLRAAAVKIRAVQFDLAESVCVAALHSLELSSKHLGLLILSKIELTEPVLADPKHSLSPGTAEFCRQLASDSLSRRSAKKLQYDSTAFQELVYKQLHVAQRRTILQALSLLLISTLLTVVVLASVTNDDHWILLKTSTYESLVSELRNVMASIEMNATSTWIQTAFDSATTPNSSMFGIALILLFATVGIDSLHQLQVSTSINQTFMEMLHEVRSAKTRFVENQMDENKVPIGTIIAYAASVPNDSVLPFGWLPCDGRALEITAFKQLFDVINHLHGFGNDESDQNHFNLPDFRGYFLRGADEDGLVDNDAEARTALGNGKPTDVGSVQDDGLKEHDHNGVTELAHGGVWFDKIWHDIPHYEPKEDWSPNCTGGGFPEHPFHRDPKYQGDEFKHQHEIRKDGIAETRPKNKYVVFLIRVA